MIYCITSLGKKQEFKPASSAVEDTSERWEATNLRISLVEQRIFNTTSDFYFLTVPTQNTPWRWPQFFAFLSQLFNIVDNKLFWYIQRHQSFSKRSRNFLLFHRKYFYKKTVTWTIQQSLVPLQIHTQRIICATFIDN